MCQAREHITLQVFGDSFATRFYNFYRRNPNLVGSLDPILVRGISGAKIADLKSFIKLNSSAVHQSSPLLVFLGTNDFLANADTATFKNNFLSFLRLLRRHYPRMVIVFTTLPIYPRIRNSAAAVARLHQTNRFLLTLRSDVIKVINLPDELNRLSFFHAYYGNSARRDGIHFNNEAFLKLIPIIEKSLLPLPTQGLVSFPE